MKELLNKIHHADCLEFMKQLPDKCIDLVLTDPPYGGHNSKDNTSCTRTGGSWSKKYQQKSSIENWDFAPTQEYFDEIFRVSKEQIIWGGNYFNLPPTRCFNVWKKLTISDTFSMAMCEYAWTSFNQNAKIFEYQPQEVGRFHPTQKPLQLIKAQLSKYIEKGVVLDPFSGSGTTALACHDLGLDFICVEKDFEYWQASCKRLEQHQRQLKLL